jgi:recombinational DNA repair protein RecR
LTKQSPIEEGETQAKVCNVCHLPYEGDECLVCRSEREQASAVVEDRGRRRGRRIERYLEGDDVD